ncbi:hypothetical protein RHGRI_035617 [Rhododendron griersonianum]|uniref:Uncharacterized protein n=1 Tax=Rhododendron griersonianum TaxID=479676 RepID=A0AAV6HQ49_9ERIC|nr:hypothetical protein RHGRI_035617 [Rhododendron griersonianum]
MPTLVSDGAASPPSPTPALVIVSEHLPQKAWGSGEDPFYYLRMTRSASKQLPQPLLLGELKAQKKRKHVDGKGPKKPRIRFRDFTIDERRDYNKRVKESEGFDVGKVPDKVLEPGLIKPIPFKSPRGVKEFNDLSRLAIEHYNKENMLPESKHWKPKSVYLDDETRKQGAYTMMPLPLVVNTQYSPNAENCAGGKHNRLWTLYQLPESFSMPLLFRNVTAGLLAPHRYRPTTPAMKSRGRSPCHVAASTCSTS